MASRPYERDSSPYSYMQRSWQLEATDEISLQDRRSALAFMQHYLAWQQLPVSVHAGDVLIQEVQWLVDWHVELETAIQFSVAEGLEWQLSRGVRQSQRHTPWGGA